MWNVILYMCTIYYCTHSTYDCVYSVIWLWYDCVYSIPVYMIQVRIWNEINMLWLLPLSVYLNLVINKSHLFRHIVSGCIRTSSAREACIPQAFITVNECCRCCCCSWWSSSECGGGFTSKLEGMFKDMELSRDIMLGFKQVSVVTEVVIR